MTRARNRTLNTQNNQLSDVPLVDGGVVHNNVLVWVVVMVVAEVVLLVVLVAEHYAGPHVLS